MSNKSQEKGEFLDNLTNPSQTVATATHEAQLDNSKPIAHQKVESYKSNGQMEEAFEKASPANLESSESVRAPAPQAELKETQIPGGVPSSKFLQQKAHPLHTNWQFWYYQRQVPFYTQQQLNTLDGMTYLKPQPPSSAEKNQEKGSYFEQLKPLGKIPSIEHFFNYYVHMKKPTEMPREIDIFFFRDQEVPMWEVGSSEFLTNSILGITKRWHMDHKDQEGRQHRQNVGVNTLLNDW